MNKYGIQFSILDLGKMRSDINLMVPGTVIATRSEPEAIKEMPPYYQDETQTLEYQLGLVGLTPKDIRTVILSHMHVDHAGYLWMRHI